MLRDGKLLLNERLMTAFLLPHPLSIKELPFFNVADLSLKEGEVNLIMEKTDRAISTKTLVMTSLLTGLSIIFTRFLFFMIPLAGLPALRLSFGEAPIMATGILFGPLIGGLSGLAADLIGVMINPQGAFFPGFTLSSVLWGVIPGLLRFIFKREEEKLDYSKLNSVILFVLLIGMLKLFISSGVLEGLSKPTIIIFSVVLLALVFLPMYLKGRGKDDKIFPFEKIVFIISITYIIISLGLNTLWLSIMFDKGFFALFPGRLLSSFASIPIHSIIISIFLKYSKKYADF